MRRTLARIAAALCAALAVFFLLPVFGGILHFGMLWPAAVLLLAAAVLLWPDFFRRLLRPRWLRSAVCTLAAVCAAVILVTLGKMAGAAVNRPPEDAACTVIVLGCQVLPDGRPSLMLENRVRAAYDYLTAHPDAVCVASGGQNDRERSSSRIRAGSTPMDASVSRTHRASVSGSRSFCPPEATHTASGCAVR